MIPSDETLLFIAIAAAAVICAYAKLQIGG